MMLLKPIYKIESEETLPRPLYEASITLQRLDRETGIKDNYRLITLINTAARPSINTHKLKSTTH